MIPGITASAKRLGSGPGGVWTPAGLPLVTWLDASDSATLTLSSGVLTAWASKAAGAVNALTEYGAPEALLESDGLASVKLDGAVMYFPNSKAVFKNLHYTGGNIFAVARFGASAEPGQLIHVLGNNGATMTKVGSQFGYEDRAAISAANNAVLIGVGNGNSSSDTNRVINHVYAGTIISAFNNRIPAAQYTVSHWQAKPQNTTLGQRGLYSRNGDALSGGNSFNGLASSLDASYDAAINAPSSGFRTAGLFALPLRVRELIVTSQVISFEDIQRVDGYLAHKWGIAGELPSDHPYKLTPPSV